MNIENYGMQRNFLYDERNQQSIKHFCHESINDENIKCKGNLICLPWKHYNSINQTWMKINSNQTQVCNSVNCEENSNSLCDLKIYWSSTSSSISINFRDDLPNETLLLFYNQPSMCTIKEICETCSNATETIKSLFSSCSLTQNILKEGNSVILNDLMANEYYNVYLIPIINNITIGSIGKLIFKTKLKAPSNVTVIKTTFNSISLQWENNSHVPPFEFQIEMISNYNKYRRNFNYVTFNNLRPCSRYCFVVSLIEDRNAEVSDKSETICDTTKHEFGNVEILPVKSELSTFRFIQWNYKEIHNCPLNFSVEYGENDNITTTKTNDLHINLTELETNKLYFIKVKSSNGAENGKVSSKEFFTKEIDDFVEDYIKTNGIFRNFITSLVFKNLPEFGNVKVFYIPTFGESLMTNVEKALKENFYKISNSKQIDIETSYSKNTMTFSFTIPQSLSYDTINIILKLMNQENRCLVVTNCTTCQNKLHETLKNVMSRISGIAVCQEKVDYKEKAFLVSHIRLKGSESNNFVSVYSITSLDNESNSILLQNKCLLILVVILLIIILILMADKKGILSIDEIISIMPIRKRRRTNLRNASSPNDSVQLKGQIRGNSNYGVNRRLLDPNHPHYKLIEEFQKICQESLLLEKSNFTSKVAVLPENMKKNRFKNILPYDQTRVVLQIRNENNDYINASRIPFIDNSELTEYIATQGPLPNTISDFWYMVWEQNISIIVMLTKVYEGVQLKCDQYWPLLLNTEFAFDENLGLSVFMEEEIKNNSFCERKLKIINRNTDEERRVTQIHVQKWNDFSRPENHDFEECLTRFHEITTGNNFSPYLIHCSAGVGRTGTFIALDRLIKKLVKENLNLEIYDVVLELRKFRQNMVQQESQYIFIHEFMDYFLCKFKRQSVECQYDNDFTEIPLN